MITDTLILTDTKIKSVDKHTHSMGGEVSAPVLSIAGVTIPTPLDPSVGATTARSSTHEKAVSILERMVFAIQYSQVKILKRKRSEVAKAADYGLHSKATWTPLWEMRGAPEEHRIDRDEESDEESDEEVLEVSLKMTAMRKSMTMMTTTTTMLMTMLAPDSYVVKDVAMVRRHSDCHSSRF